MKSTAVKLFLAIGLAFILSQSGYSQTISSADKKKLKAKEDTLQQFARYLITDTLTEDRMVSDSVFTRTLVRALQIKNSFYYPSGLTNRKWPVVKDRQLFYIFLFR